MKRILAVLTVGLLGLVASCQDYLNVNTNPNAPTSVSANLYLAPMQHWMFTSVQYDGRFIGHLTQQWYSTSTSGTSPAFTWAKMGYDKASDNGGEQWRDVYWSLGQNLVDMMNKSAAEQRWDLLGVGQVMKAWGWQALTDLHGEIIIKEAFDPTRTQFDYDTQQYAYFVADSLLQEAIKNLQRSDGAVDATYLAKGDHVYNGDRTKWLKLAYGLLAINHHHYTNKSTYNATDVVSLVDKSFASNADDALLQYPGTSAADLADYSFYGRSRNNITAYRQTQFVVNLMNGTDFGGVVDPRMSRMLVLDSANTAYRGLDINVSGFGALSAAQQPRNPFGYTGTNGLGLPGRYVFDDKSKFPLVTYAELQFIKAEAAFKGGDRATALAAYRNAISAHIDFVNARNNEVNQSIPQITSTEKATFLGSPAIVPGTAAALTLTQIMSQKYVAQWGWGHDELWMDMRRYHYTDIDPATGAQIYPGFTPATVLYSDNAGKLAYRIRPRYNSEYVWNSASLQPIGGLDPDYQTKPLWIIQP